MLCQFIAHLLVLDPKWLFNWQNPLSLLLTTHGRHNVTMCAVFLLLTPTFRQATVVTTRLYKQKFIYDCGRSCNWPFYFS